MRQALTANAATCWSHIISQFPMPTPSPFRSRIVLIPIAASCLFLSGCSSQFSRPATALNLKARSAAITALQRAGRPETIADKIVAGAQSEVERGVVYDASYQHIRYPGGDIPRSRGACTDVIIRALRFAGYDLQKLIHEDKVRHPRLYPLPAGEKSPNTDIDHRRIPNHLVFFRRHGLALSTVTTGAAARTWLPGDLVYWSFGGLNHCGVLSHKRDPQGLPFVIHNLSQAAEEDCLTSWKIAAHYRYPPR